ncbi:Bile pigment transporter 1 [Phytophthora fragariae]|uniref:Bile pigment transporter 1 n=1 Tax=Phytophthora fragariae TaxID=53985 RepID=A0A6G0NFQ4_9STRA|nr:Bile pigment transporter 1 [Phytophthora fragariae]
MPLRSPADGDDAKGVSQERKPEYGAFSASKGPKDAEKPAPSPSQKPPDPDPAPSKSPEKTLPPLHPESPATAWWRKLFIEFFDKKQLDSELDASQVWDLTAEHTSVEAAAAFRQVYAQSLQCRSNCRIKRAIIRTHKWKLAACWALQLASLLCDACTPVLLYMLLAMAISREYTQTQIYASLGLLYVTALGEVLLHCHSHFLGFKINIKIVGALRALVFENTISQPEHIPGHAAGSYDSESGKKRMAEVAHLYAEDVANVARMVTHMQFLWRSVLQIVFELCILVQVIGIKFKPVAIAFLSMAVFAKFLSAAGSRLQRKLQKKIEARLNVIHECFKGIQMVKLNAWEDKMQDKIERARKEENRERRRVNLVAALQYCVGVDSPNMASIFIFGWVAMQDTSALSPARVFPALLLLRRIKTHFSNTAQLFDVASKGQASFSKIDSYLNECDAKFCAQDQTEKARGMQLSNVGSNGPETVVAMEHACFGQSTEEGKALLVNVSFRLRRGQLAMLQGKAGAGKSTLLNALLGNIKCIDGDVSVARDCKIAYCAQEPWLQTLSIRDNILFGSEFDSKKYWCVVEACCLKDDLRMLPQGDNTQVGPKGINLSGGQKARIALARACYADADIYLLDCPFASVDAIVQNEIFTKCIVELLRFKTVLMVTHNRELSSSSFVDHVIRVEDLTVVVESAEKGWDVGRHPSRRVDPRNSLPPWRGENKHDDQKSKHHPRGLALWESVALPLSSPALLVKSIASKPVTASGSTQVPVTSECVGAKVARKFKWKDEWFSIKTWKMLLKGGKCMRYHVPAKFFLFLYAFAVTSKDVFLMKWSDRVDHGDVSNMDSSANFYAFLVISSVISGFASSVLHAHAMANSANSMFHEMTAALLRAPMTFFYSMPVGELFNRYFNDIRVLDTSFALAFMAMFRSAVTILAADGILWYFTGVVGTSIILIVLYVVKEFMTLGFMVGLLQLSFRAEAANLNFISEALDGSATIRAFGRQQINRFRMEHGVLSDELMKGQYHTEAFNRFVLIRCDRVLGIHMLLLMFLLSIHNVSPAELGLMLYYVFTINSDVYTLSAKLLEVALCLLNVERVRKYGLIEPELQSYEGNPLTIPASWPHRGDIVFDHVSFSYASSPDELANEMSALALCDVSFSVKGGEKIGVVGRTGSGKSSLAMALLRVHPLAKGRIIVDGLDASLLSLSALRTNVCIIPQSPLFYRCSVRNYLDPFNEFGHVALLHALRRCGLKGSMANLEAELSDNSENWSLGERQMLCLARAVLRPSRIVVLDEYFSAVDQSNQSALLNVLDTAFRDSTIFLITHRLDDVLQFDNILVMQEGRAVEFGPAEDLAADPDSAFYEFLETTLLTY